MQFLIGSSVFILGAIIGSFLNVLVLRRGTGLGLFRSSFCFACGGRLSARDIIPIVSFFIHEGKCRMCKSNISSQYPFVEIAAGGIFLAIAWKAGLLAPGFAVFGNSEMVIQLLVTGYWLLIASILLAITVYDIRHKIIPNAWVYLLNLLAFASLLQFSNFNFQISNFWTPFFTGVGFFLFFGAFWFFSRGRWMGLGDAKLALGIGWLLGLSAGIAALILAFWIGALVGVALLTTQKLFQRATGRTMNMKSEIPFAPFLVAGMAIVWFFDLTFAHLQALFLF